MISGLLVEWFFNIGVKSFETDTDMFENIEYTLASHNNMLATEYMLDMCRWTYTSNAKSAYQTWFKSDYAEWAIGGPTAELLAKSYDAYNAAAMSLPVKIDNAQYVVTGINAAINNLNVIKSVTDIPIDGAIMLGRGVNANHPGWAPFTGYHALYHGELPDLNVAIMHEIMHSIGLASYANDVEEITSLYGGVTYNEGY